ncbi:hypothetical protein [Muricoccus radiodurans]|uniref:hypothetical protein n=1 Tax=Muricoccus radiodurans TaxID=2231721 RepID=UPI003CEE7849
MTRRPVLTLALLAGIAAPALAGCVAGPYDVAYGPGWGPGYDAPAYYVAAPPSRPYWEPARYEGRRDRDWDRRYDRRAEPAPRRWRDRDAGYADAGRPGRAPTLEQRARRGEQPNQTGLWGGTIGTPGN